MFEKGKSGNPGGRSKKDIELEEHARLHAKEAIDVLIREMRDCTDPQVRVRAANLIIERACGKPKESVTLTHVRSITEFDDAELEAVVRAGRSGNGTAAPQASSSKPH